MKKKAWIAVIVVIAIELVSMLGSYMVQTSGLSVKQEVITCSMNDLVKMINENNAKYGKDLGDTLSKGSDGQISLSVYTPKNATVETPAPCVVCAHGWNNSKEMQLMNFVELSRRGFVVVAVDLAGHGRSDVSLQDETGWGKGNTECVAAAIEYAMSLGCVDETQVGAVGHSAGDLAIGYAIQMMNTEGSKKHISAYCCSAGALSAFLLSMQLPDKSGLLLGVPMGEYEEMGSFGFDLKTIIFNGFAPGQLEPGAPAPLGEYYNAEGKIETPAGGEKLSTDTAVILYLPKVTHPSAVISNEVGSITVDFFYAAFGVPAGAEYIASSSMVWGWGAFFQTLGLLGFFASIFAFGAALLKTKAFASLLHKAPEGEQLPRLKSFKEIIPLVVTFVPLCILAYVMYFPCFNRGDALISENIITPVVSGLAWYTMASGLVAFALIFVNWFVKKLCYCKDGIAVQSAFATGRIGGFGEFMKTVGFCALLVFLVYIPQIVAFHVFDVNFGISVYAVGVPRLIWLPEVLTKYLPFWLLFLIPNAMLNNRARFRDVPEWVTTLFVTLANLLPILILTIVNYYHLFKTGNVLYTSGDPSIFAWNIFAPMILIGISNRFFYRKTGNIWIGAITNATIMTLMATTITRHISDIAFFM